MDCLCGAGTLALGHNHPAVVEAIREHLENEYPLHSLDLTTPLKHRFVEEIFSTLPPEFASKARIQFCSPSWAIVGGESGPRARPMPEAWVVEILEMCRAAQTAFFFKQWGGRNKKAAGRVLNGRTYDEMPALRRTV
jgi:protein gp37